MKFTEERGCGAAGEQNGPHDLALTARERDYRPGYASQPLSG
jgi:hypothetical protein